MPNKFRYKNCGCSFDILKDGQTPSIAFDLDINNLNLECKKTWQLLSDGNTKGCFQLESRLGQSLAKKLKPSNIEELAALVSIMRPGCLEAIRENKSVTNHYIDKKNGSESIDYFHKSLEPILHKTYGEMIYQEQAMQIAQKIAGFDLREADMLRKAIGKKKPEEMSKLKRRFIDGAKSVGLVQEHEAQELFNWIEKSQRYSFNKSHAVSYAFNAFLSAYAKAHFPKIFFMSYLMYAKDKIDPQREIRELVNNAREMGINVSIPDLRLMNENFIIHNNSIIFGLTNVKGFGGSVYNKLQDMTKYIDLYSISFPCLYFKVLQNLNSAAIKSLIVAGGLDYFGKPRNYLLAAIDCLDSFTKGESDKILNTIDTISHTSIEDFIKCILSFPCGRGQYIVSQKRHEILSNAFKLFVNPPFALVDSPEWIADNEYVSLGVSITCSKVDGCDQIGANATCSQFKTIMANTINIACEIIDTKIVKTKKGKNPGAEMVFVSASDSTGSLNSIVCFPEQYSKYKHLLNLGNTVVISGSKGKDSDSFVVKKIWQI